MSAFYHKTHSNILSKKQTGSVMNFANLTQEEKDKINVDLAASGVAYKERLNMYESLGVTRTYLPTGKLSRIFWLYLDWILMGIFLAL